MTTALNGLKVLDFSTLLPGPFATMYLADMGAEVIHIESPSRPDLIRIMPPYANGQATAHSYLNRNKQSIVLDLKNAASIDLIKAKISEFDVVIENVRYLSRKESYLICASESGKNIIKFFVPERRLDDIAEGDTIKLTGYIKKQEVSKYHGGSETVINRVKFL